ncbi:rod shape-determining protein, partial [Patescibacteria group bacterium]|nr:rod shape-determining protein [Patescibacteria group bacterium]
MLSSIWSLFTHDLAIDLGTSNTRVYVLGKGIAFREPTTVARQKKSKQMLVVGEGAKKMMGKTPASIEAISPLKGGVIADFDATQALLKYYFDKTHNGGRGFPMVPRPRVILGIPTGVTEVERR